MNYRKQKIFEILLTAILSAGIAFLQSILAQQVGINAGNDVPVVAGVLGAVVRSCRA